MTSYPASKFAVPVRGPLARGPLTNHDNSHPVSAQFTHENRGIVHTVETTKTNKEENAMQDRLLRRREVEKITGMSRSSIYRLMQEGGFPRPVKVGPAAVRWKTSDITAWIESRPVAIGEFSQPSVRQIQSDKQFSRVGNQPTAASGRGGAQTGRTSRRLAPLSFPGCERGLPLIRPMVCPSAPASSS